MKKKNKLSFADKVKFEIREHKNSFIVFVVLTVLVSATLVRQFFAGNYESVFLCVLTLFLMIVPAIVEVSFKIEIPPVLNIIVMLFVFSAEILGEINSFYFIFPYWDTILHTLNGFLAAAIGCSLIVTLNKSNSLMFSLSPIFVALVSFCFSMTIGVVWEFFEFGLDYFLGYDTQKDTVINQINSTLLDPTQSNIVISIKNIEETIINGEPLGVGGYLDIGLYDTMMDMIVNFIGAVVFSVFGYFYTKSQGKKGKLTKTLMLSSMNKDKVNYTFKKE